MNLGRHYPDHDPPIPILLPVRVAGKKFSGYPLFTCSDHRSPGEGKLIGHVQQDYFRHRGSINSLGEKNQKQIGFAGNTGGFNAFLAGTCS